jgi:hypothetical protein
MPAASAKQKKFMDAAAHNPAFAKKAGVPVKVAKEFSKASKGQTFKEDGEMKESKGMMKKEVGFMKAKGAPKSMMKPEMVEMRGKKKMASGGMPMVMKDGKKIPAFAADGKGKMAHGGMTHKMAHGGMTKKMMDGGYAKGGSASSRADGIVQKGKTKGKMLAKGGKAC